MTIKEKKCKLDEYCRRFDTCSNGCKLVDHPCYLQTDEEIEKQYEKKTLHLPVWINNVASESVLLVPRDKFNEALKEEKGNK